MQTERKLYTAELQRMKRSPQADVVGLPPLPTAAAAVAGPEVMDLLREIRDSLRILNQGTGGTVALPEPVVDVAPAVEENQTEAEISFLRTELRALSVCIEKTKHEIAALRPSSSEDDRLMSVTFELDAIVSATEKATQSILEAAENIDTLIGEIKSNVQDSYAQQRCDDVGDIIISIYEACNFQDITGQRITKVVKILQYIEDRINAMTHIWGEGNIDELVPQARSEHQDEEAQLLNGPQLEHMAISQDDIDKLFD